MKNIIRIIILTVGLYSMQAQTVLEQTITANTSYLGQYATVNLTIDDANGDNEITHPLIVAEGFDLGVVIAPENENGYQDYHDFQRTVFNSSSFDLQNLILNSGKDYDIIYVDWDNGVDYLQRNAYALEAVIEWVNSVKIGTEQNVILGESMGGVIARWALADMEERSLTHDTRLFISHDAPQQGANIPASLQFMYRHGGNQYIQTGQTLGGAVVTVPLLEVTVGVSNYLSLLDTPATKQLLKNTATTSYTMVNTYHNTFYNNLKNKGLSGSNGYPINCRNIALSNGSECGNTQDFNPGDHLVDYQWNKGLSFWGDLASLVYNPLGGFLGGILVDKDLFGVAALGLIPGHSKYNVDFQAKATPYGSGNQIYKGVISYTKKIIWLFNVTVNITNVQKNQPTGILPFDTYGGGFYNVGEFIDTSALPSGVFIRDKFSFISTASALDIGENNVTLNDSDYLKSYVGANPPSAPKNSPFNNYSTEFDNANPNAGNFSHITFNTRNGDWLAAELVGTNVEFSNCSAFCSSTEITGSDTVCSSETFSVTSEATAVNWSIIEGNTLVNSTLIGNTLTLEPQNINGYVTISVNYSNSTCGNATGVTKRVWIGKPKVTSYGINGGSSNVFTNSLSFFSVNAPEGNTSYYWWITPAGGCSSGSGPTINNSNPYTTLYTSATVSWGSCPGTYSVVCWAQNDCGTTSIGQKFITVNYPNTDPCNNFSLLVSANSNKGIDNGVTINLLPNPEPCPTSALSRTANETYRVAVYDIYGTQKFSGNFNSKKISLDNLRLTKGIYILKVISSNGIDETKKLFIN